MTNLSEREQGRVGGGEEWRINKWEVTELQGTGGQFSSTQRGQSRGHWPFPPFLSLCPPPSDLSIYLPNAKSLSVSFVANLFLSVFFLCSKTHPNCLLYFSAFVHLIFLHLNPPFTSTCSLIFATLFFYKTFTSIITVYYYYFCSLFPVWVQQIAMWGAVLLTKHKVFHIQPAPGILGYRSLYACVYVGNRDYKTDSGWDPNSQNSKKGGKKGEIGDSVVLKYY